MFLEALLQSPPEVGSNYVTDFLKPILPEFDSETVQLWWLIMCFASLCNCIHVSRKFYRLGQEKTTSYKYSTTFYSLIFCYVCAFRSFWPRQDVEKVCIFDHWISSVVLGRGLATVAELCLILQFHLFFVAMYRRILVHDRIFGNYDKINGNQESYISTTHSGCSQPNFKPMPVHEISFLKGYASSSDALRSTTADDISSEEDESSSSDEDTNETENLPMQFMKQLTNKGATMTSYKAKRKELHKFTTHWVGSKIQHYCSVHANIIAQTNVSPDVTGYYLSKLANIAIRLMVPLISLAECCSWIGVCTRIELWNAVEESLWAFTFMSMIIIVMDLKHIIGVMRSDKPEMKTLERFLVILLTSFSVYVWFMLYVDIPMYVQNFMASANVKADLFDKEIETFQEINSDFELVPSKVQSPLWSLETAMIYVITLLENLGVQQYITAFGRGFVDSLECKHISTGLDLWGPHLSWMLLYFTFVCWISMALSSFDPYADSSSVEKRREKNQFVSSAGILIDHLKNTEEKLRQKFDKGKEKLKGLKEKIDGSHKLQKVRAGLDSGKQKFDELKLEGKQKLDGIRHGLQEKIQLFNEKLRLKQIKSL